MPQQSSTLTSASVLDHLRRDGDHPSGFLALDPGNAFFVDDSGFVAYRRAGRYRFVFGGPVGSAADEAQIFDRFLQDSERAGHRVVAVQVPERSLDLFVQRGFVLNQLGSTYTVDLSRATLDGPVMRKPRQGVRRGERAGGRVLEVGVDLPWTEHLREQLDTVDARWLGQSGKSAKPLRFMVGSRHGDLRDQRRLFVVEHAGRIIGYSQCVPAFGSRPGWLYDLNRLEPGSPDVGDLQVWSVMKRLQEEGAPYFHLGFTPFAELDLSSSSTAVPSSRVGALLLRLLTEHGERLYPTAGAVAWKRKWQPVTVAPEYIAFPSRLRPGAVARLLRLTNVI
jgi:lysylphosphatidylglycerol synthetase-like protein (DUF2156 family)